MPSRASILPDSNASLLARHWRMIVSSANRASTPMNIQLVDTMLLLGIDIL